MLDFGTVSGHSNRLYLSDVYGQPTSYTFFAFVKPDGWASNNGTFFGRYVAASDDGWILRQRTDSKIEVYHADAGNDLASASTTAFSDQVTESLALYWDGSTMDYYKGGVADGTDGTFSNGINNTAAPITIGNFSDVGTNGCGGQIGQVMYWHQEDKSADIATLHAGASIPGLATLDLWHRGTVVIGPDGSPAGGGNFTDSGTVGLVADPVDAYYQTVGQWRLFVACAIPWVASAAAKSLFGACITYSETWRYMNTVLGKKHWYGDFSREWEFLRDYLRKGTTWHSLATPAHC